MMNGDNNSVVVCETKMHTSNRIADFSRVRENNRNLRLLKILCKTIETFR